MPSLVEQVAAAAASELGPIADHTIATTVDGIRQVIRDELIANLSGKEIIVKIQIPDLMK